jgi:hypothetical protein
LNYITTGWSFIKEKYGKAVFNGINAITGQNANSSQDNHYKAPQQYPTLPG